MSPYRLIRIAAYVTAAISPLLQLGLSVTPAFSAEPAYTLTVVAQTGSRIAGHKVTAIGPPSIGNSGRVVFRAGYAGQIGIFGRSNLLVKNGDVIGGKKVSFPLFDFDERVGINDSDKLIFTAQFPGGRGIFTQRKLILQTGDVIDGKRIDSLSWPTINDSGAVAFAAGFVGSDMIGGFGIFRQDHFLFRLGDTIDGHYVASPTPPVIDNHGTVAAVFYTGDEPNDGSAIFVSPSRIFATSSDVIGGTVVQQICCVALSGVGKVVFSGGGHLFTRAAILPTDTIDELTIGTAFSGSVNDAGMVAFVAQFPSGLGEGIFTLDHKIVTTADLIRGKRPVSFDIPRINNQDEVVFRATFADGSVAVVLAQPTGRAVNLHSDLTWPWFREAEP